MPEVLLSETAPALAQRYLDVRRHSERLIAPLGPEDCAVQSMPDASPAKWHLAHTTWFFETLVVGAFVPGYKPFDPAYGFLFNSYYEGLGPRHPRAERGLLTRPGLEEILAYRRHVDGAIIGVLGLNDAHALVELGLHHEQQHQELILTDIKHAFFSNPLLPAYAPGRAAQSAKPLEWLRHDGGIVSIGAGGESFAFDNERPRHQVLLRPFRIASRPVTSGEYRAFIAEGGYRRAEFWLSDGWALVNAEHWTAPLYWLDDDSVFTLSGVAPVDPDAPLAHVSFFEAAAYAQWAGKRLPTEFEWEAASASFEHGAVWEWTRSAYDPYPGYRPFEGEAGEYNGKFMSGQMVLRGGSEATPPGHARATYRNFFPAKARWQFSGIRLAEDV